MNKKNKNIYNNNIKNSKKLKIYNKFIKYYIQYFACLKFQVITKFFHQEQFFFCYVRKFFRYIFFIPKLHVMVLHYLN